MQSVAQERSDTEATYSAKAEIEHFVQSFLDLKRETSASARFDFDSNAEQRSLDTQDLCNALNMVDLVYSRIDAERIRCVQLEVQLEVEVLAHRKIVNEWIVKYDTLHAENNDLKARISVLESPSTSISDDHGET